MQANRGRDTGPELELRRLLHAAGLRYRVDWPVPGQRRRRMDIAFTRRKVAVFVDGCYWHQCQDHYVVPKTNVDYWLDKVARNVARDQETNRLLTQSGWTVLRFWEHESAAGAAQRVIEVVRAQ
jgi:DNA mismatch endonuclease (patch repair protein)